MDNMDIPLPYDSSELMSSEFFDSVFSLEQEGLMGSLDGGLSGNFDDDMFLSSETSSHADEVNSTNSLSSTDCDKFSGTDSVATSPASNVDAPENDLLLSLIASQNQVKIQPQVTLGQKPTKLIINNGSTKRVIIPKQIVKKPAKPKQHIFRVQTENGRSLLLPLNISNVKSIKIVNSNSFKEQTVAPLIAQDLLTLSPSKSIPEEDIEVSSEETHYPPLNLTAEEKRLLAKDGIQLPTHYPLTKNEERELKRIRRKIRNKISAQDSRKRKKEYVDGLEERVKRGSEENKFLMRRVKQLQKQNSRLMEQMSKLQALIFNSGTSKATPTTCLMIVLFSALLVSLPNLNISNNKGLGDQQEVTSLGRTLLFNKQAANEEDALNMEEYVRFGKKEEADLENSTEAVEMELAADKEAGLIKLLQEIKKEYNIPADKINCLNANSGLEKLTEYCDKYQNDIHSILGNIRDFFESEVKLFNEKEVVNPKIDYGGLLNENGFIEPDIDDSLDDVGREPISKKAKLEIDTLNEIVVNSNTFAINSSKKE